MRNGDDNAHRNKCLAQAATGAVLGLAAAVIIAAACTLLLSGAAYGAQSGARAGALNTALADCEAGAARGAPSAAALGACDFALDAAAFDEDARPSVLANRGVIALARGDSAGARRDLEEAARLQPSNARIQLNLAAALIAVGRHADAMEIASALIEARGENIGQAWFNYAVAAERNGDYDTAYTAYLAAADAAPDNRLFAAQPGRFLRHQPAG